MNADARTIQRLKDALRAIDARATEMRDAMMYSQIDACRDMAPRADTIAEMARQALAGDMACEWFFDNL